MPVRQKPVVVLLGWLGSHPRNLRRYVELYENLGWNSLIRIASPPSVVTAMTEGPHTATMINGQNYGINDSIKGSNNSYFPRQHSTMLEMERLAVETLQELQTTCCPYFIVHNFSNGGCFVWEWIRFILYEQPSTSPFYPTIDVENLKNKLVGLVFDSSPCHYEARVDTLLNALEYVSLESAQKQAFENARALSTEAVAKRFDAYWDGLSKDPRKIPQLYLYSEVDHLSSYKEVEKLINFRKELIGKDLILKHNFLNSEHCCHLLKHREEYSKSIQQFTKEVVRKDRRQIIESPKADENRSRL